MRISVNVKRHLGRHSRRAVYQSIKCRCNGSPGSLKLKLVLVLITPAKSRQAPSAAVTAATVAMASRAVHSYMR